MQDQLRRVDTYLFFRWEDSTKKKFELTNRRLRENQPILNHKLLRMHSAHQQESVEVA